MVQPPSRNRSCSPRYRERQLHGVIFIKNPPVCQGIFIRIFCPAIAGRPDHDGTISAVKTPLQAVSPARQTLKA
jgi:hypothetical protein